MSWLWGALPEGADLGELLSTGVSPRVPFGHAGHRRDEVTGEGRRRRDAAIAAVLARRPVLHEVDPRTLLATQGGLDRAGVLHYLGSAFADIGLTYADHDSVGNADPVVYLRARDGARLILAGHHRASAALLRGRPLLARLVVEPGAEAPPPLDPSTCPVTATLRTTADGQADAEALLRRRGADPRHSARRVSYALSGRFS